MSPNNPRDRVQRVRFRFAAGDTSLGFASAVIDGRERRFVVRRFGWRIVPPATGSAYPNDVRRELERVLFFAAFREWACVLRRLRTSSSLDAVYGKEAGDDGGTASAR
jgi:hypothetical protein